MNRASCVPCAIPIEANKSAAKFSREDSSRAFTRISLNGTARPGERNSSVNFLSDGRDIILPRQSLTIAQHPGSGPSIKSRGNIDSLLPLRFRAQS